MWSSLTPQQITYKWNFILRDLDLVDLGFEDFVFLSFLDIKPNFVVFKKIQLWQKQEKMKLWCAKQELYLW